ncbi:uncharacterized protein J3D65DRAFT_616096 [Phyllosticta citribraziliensis]|uniref:HAUS augmin-like complex subunit 1 n=1 Tax=Phyllosticta citribraziliensis TaxID=989973 RepID=A0ABR1M2T1_9PEZI
MDYNHLSPDALFSPSKAAQQRAQAHDWQHVETWLSKLYPGQRLPAFERNEETLKALMAMAAANERADEEAALLNALEDEVRDELDATSNLDDDDSTAALVSSIESSLSPTGLRALDFLTRLTSSLPSSTYSPTALAHALISQSAHLASLSAHHDALAHLRLQLAATLHDVRATHDALTTDPALAPHAALPRQTTDFARQTKHLLPKLREYEERLAALAAGCPWSPANAASAARPSTAGSTASTGSTLGAAAPPGSTSPTLSRRGANTAARRSPAAAAAGGAEDDVEPPTHLLSSSLNPFSASALAALVAQTRDVDALRQEVEASESQVRAFKDLPADRDEARRVVRAREAHLAQLRAERDGAFEGLVG